MSLSFSPWHDARWLQGAIRASVTRFGQLLPGRRTIAAEVRFTKSWLLLLSVNLAACSTNTPAGDRAAPPVGTGPAIAQDAMPEYCQNAAATQFGDTVGVISTNPAAPAKSGFAVQGSSDGGSQPAVVFTCRFDSNGKFLDVIEGISAN